MIIAWIITISLFAICLSATVIIMDGVKQTDEMELANLHSQYKNIEIKSNNLKKVS